jgi:hypothetical protein
MTDPWAETTGKRSGVISVFCILIFIFGGYAAWSNFGDWISPPDEDQVGEQMHQMEQTMKRFSSGEEEAKEMEAEMRDAFEVLLLNSDRIGMWKFVASIGAIIGAILLWRLRRVGLHVYLISGLVWAIAPILVVGGNVLTYAMAFLYGLVVLIFSVVFFSQRKRLV